MSSMPRADWAAFEEHSRTRAALPRLVIWDLLGLGGLSLLLFFFHLGSYGLWEPDEGRYAEIAREMAIGGSKMIPHLNYVPYLEKPPLLYWLTWGCFRLFGVNAMAARLVPALAAMAGVGIVYLFAWRAWDRRRALVAGAILATSPLYTAMAQVLTTDMLLATLLAAGFFCFYLQWNEGRWWWLGLYVACGLAVLTKGPIGIVLPALTGAIFLLARRQLKGAIRRFRVLPGVAITMLVAAPWFVAVSIRQPDFVDFYFVGEHLRRFLQLNYSHAEPIYFFLPVVILGMLPWSALWLPIIRAGSPGPARTFVIVIAATVLGFFSLSRAKLIPYILPMMPAVAILIADAIVSTLEAGELDARGNPAMTVTCRRAFALTWVVMVVLGAVALALAEAAPSFRSGYISMLEPELYAMGVVLALGSAAGSVTVVRGAPRGGLIVLTLTMVAALIVGSYGRLQVESMRSFARLGRTIAVRAPRAPIVCFHRYVQGLPFYTARRVILVGSRTELDYGYRHSADAHNYFFEDESDLLRLWTSLKGAVVVLDTSDLANLESQLGNFQVIAAERKKRAIVRVAKAANAGQRQSSGISLTP